MVLTNNAIKKHIEGYSNKNTKICREVKNGNLIKIKNGLYETNSNVKGYLLANSIYGPSYLSFDFALSYYGLISEKTTTFTCATYNKKKKKRYDNQFGTYLYRDVPTNVYSLGINTIQEDGYNYKIATPEKALCDKLYTLNPIKNMEKLEEVIFNDLKIDYGKFIRLKIKKLVILANSYHCTNINLLVKYLIGLAKMQF